MASGLTVNQMINFMGSSSLSRPTIPWLNGVMVAAVDLKSAVHLDVGVRVPLELQIMRSLKEYFYRPFCEFDIIRRKYIEDVREYFNGDIPECLIDRLNSDNFITDYILENLLSHDTEKLKNKIIDKFSDKYNDIEFQTLTNTKEKYDVKGFALCSNHVDDIYKDESFQNMIKFYGYYITDSTSTHLIIVPTYPENVSDFVYKTNKGILYHFTANEYADEILNKGLRCKSGKYKEFPERIYLYSCGYKKIKDIPNIEKFINSVVNVYDKQRYGLSIFKINLNKIPGSNIEFYTDEQMDEKEAVFTYNNIPKECITKINKW